MLFRSDRKSTRLNSSHLVISYAVFCLKKKKKHKQNHKQQPAQDHEWVGREQLSCAGHSLSAGVTPVLDRFFLGWFFFFFFFFNDTATTEIYPLSLHDALPI